MKKKEIGSELEDIINNNSTSKGWTSLIKNSKNYMLLCLSGILIFEYSIGFYYSQKRLLDKPIPISGNITSIEYVGGDDLFGRLTPELLLTIENPKTKQEYKVVYEGLLNKKLSVGDGVFLKAYEKRNDRELVTDKIHIVCEH